MVKNVGRFSNEVGRVTDKFLTNLYSKERNFFISSADLQDGMSVLHLAAKFGQLKVIDMLWGKTATDRTSVKVRQEYNVM